MPLLSRFTLICMLLTLPLAGAFGADDMPRVRLSTTLGDIVLELDRDKAPQSVENFLSYVRDGAYDGTIFHRVIDGFMIQGGGYTTEFVKVPTRAPIRNEANNGLRNMAGTVAMARSNDPHSATSQFFINVVDNDYLNHRSETLRGWGYAVFGRVVEGMDVVEQIKRAPTGKQEVAAPGSRSVVFNDVPRTPIVINKAVEDAIVLQPLLSPTPETPSSPFFNQ